ncbi:hypothetical protein CONLIGDRAFT_681636 [Coniochaeta ligniaria NRRL 30616]|uniref:Uncharacterized protein n=1 Tax=Coniochaeta ligniaria NRRL 30616 TaxID=1408157 RepID=A0A1J7JHD0_9PEZI|nr:hypothetical protein CONLIGDRAFT_681636 [Coniochaeta ligniaria NRRL 30616]
MPSTITQTVTTIITTVTTATETTTAYVTLVALADVADLLALGQTTNDSVALAGTIGTWVMGGLSVAMAVVAYVIGEETEAEMEEGRARARVNAYETAMTQTLEMANIFDRDAVGGSPAGKTIRQTVDSIITTVNKTSGREPRAEPAEACRRRVSSAPSGIGAAAR